MESVLDQVAADAIASALARTALMEQEAIELDAAKVIESITLAQTRYVYAKRRMYRVYDKPHHFTLIEADSAHEAFAKSGIASPIKIQRESFFTRIAIAQDQIETTDERVRLDTSLPTHPDKKTTMDMQQIDAEIEARKPVFEAMSFRDAAMHKAAKASAPAFAPIAVPELSQQAESLMDGAPMPSPEPELIAAPPEAPIPPTPPAPPQALAAADEAQDPQAIERELSIDEVNALLNTAGGEEA